ncbi:putative transcriptional regulator SLK2 [Glycine soja]|uniref:Putative transcriptional regulator SLK2 n=1 Tax=Glycine soja TaxID=3848 RepID=A0A445J128_GLYSO|nr:putative transcriptional regulator SLK2 [Glycine soja]
MLRDGANITYTQFLSCLKLSPIENPPRQQCGLQASADLSPTKLHNHFHGACPNRDRPLLLTRWRVAGLALESYLDSNQGGMPPMTPSRVSGSLTRSSSHSGIFFQGDGQSQNIVNSHLSSSFVNSSSTVPGAGCSNLGPVSGDINNAVLNTVTNSAPSVGASSLVTDANSALSSGPHLQRSASVNTDSYLRLPASPMSFTLNNISISGSSVMDGSSVVQ